MDMIGHFSGVITAELCISTNVPPTCDQPEIPEMAENGIKCLEKREIGLLQPVPSARPGGFAKPWAAEIMTELPGHRKPPN